MPKYHKSQRGICLALFSVAGTYSLYNPHVFKTAALSLIGVIAYDIVCYFKGKSTQVDYAPAIEALKVQHDETAAHVKDMKNDVGLAKLGSTFRK